ncbi:MAG: hypothetical protein H8E66_12225 [Planctomycetes bacterium]|nr:hypothetical protein [Planctomycetota bacterium]
MEVYIPIGSLIIAALALIVGPYVSWHVAKHQADTSLRVANKQIISPIRHTWIDTLRNRVAEIISEAHWYYVAGEEDQFSATDKKLVFLRRQVELMLNPAESDHQELNQRLDAVVASGMGNKDKGSFPDNVQQATTVCQGILKREWERVKTEI